MSLLEEQTVNDWHSRFCVSSLNVKTEISIDFFRILSFSVEENCIFLRQLKLEILMRVYTLVFESVHLIILCLLSTYWNRVLLGSPKTRWYPGHRIFNQALQQCCPELVELQIFEKLWNVPTDSRNTENLLNNVRFSNQDEAVQTPVLICLPLDAQCNQRDSPSLNISRYKKRWTQSNLREQWRTYKFTNN